MKRSGTFLAEDGEHAWACAQRVSAAASKSGTISVIFDVQGFLAGLSRWPRFTFTGCGIWEGWLARVVEIDAHDPKSLGSR